MQAYCLGFLFNDSNEVLLVRKNKPDWQKGLLNGVGGKIEENESPSSAMIREFKEEVGEIKTYEWDLFHKMFFKDCVVCCYRSFTEEDLRKIDGKKNDVGEPLWLVNTEIIETVGCITNLTWLVPMAKDQTYEVGDSHFGLH